MWTGTTGLSQGLAEGAWLADREGVRAIIDLSDGIASDMKHVIKASGAGAILELGRIPLSRQLREVSEKYGWDPLDLAVYGGEDYTLLFTVEENEAENISLEFFEKFGYRMYTIGHIENNGKSLTFTANGKKIVPEGRGFKHF